VVFQLLIRALVTITLIIAPLDFVYHEYIHLMMTFVLLYGIYQ